MTKAAIYLGYTFVFCLTLFYVKLQNQTRGLPTERIGTIEFLEPIQMEALSIHPEKIIMKEDYSGHYDEIRYDEFL